MRPEFEADLAALRRDLDGARAELLAVVGTLGDVDLARDRSGEWSVRQVLHHVIQSEWLYARMVAQLREFMGAPGEMSSVAPASAAEPVRGLDAARQALLAALVGVDEESFYRLRPLKERQASIRGILEHAAHHDREHAEQLRVILGVGGPGPE